jgi:hypothetical protein
MLQLLLFRTSPATSETAPPSGSALPIRRCRGDTSFWKAAVLYSDGVFVSTSGPDASAVFASDILLQAGSPGHLLWALVGPNGCFIRLARKALSSRAVSVHAAGGDRHRLFCNEEALVRSCGRSVGCGGCAIDPKRSHEQSIPISEIVNVSYAELQSPPRVTLSLRKTSVFGEQISFCAPLRIMPVSKSPVIVELIERVRAARRLRRRRLLKRLPTTSTADRVDVDGRRTESERQT